MGNSCREISLLQTLTATLPRPRQLPPHTLRRHPGRRRHRMLNQRSFLYHIIYLAAPDRQDKCHFRDGQKRFLRDQFMGRYGRELRIHEPFGFKRNGQNQLEPDRINHAASLGTAQTNEFPVTEKPPRPTFWTAPERSIGVTLDKTRIGQIALRQQRQHVIHNAHDHHPLMVSRATGSSRPTTGAHHRPSMPRIGAPARKVSS